MAEISKIFFGGEYYHSLDEKGRVLLPGPHRIMLAISCSPNLFYLGYLPGTSFLNLYTREKFESILLEWDNQDRFSSTQEYMDAKRLFFSKIDPVEPDKAGRILIPQKFRDWLGLTKDLVIAGARDKIEIWNLETYKKYEKEAEIRLATKINSLLDSPEVAPGARFPSW
ncbi:MAG: division/cell wall cluster transcriptional repressor MraZ [Deltaproteobacteria bacterium]|jgi:MraZ protein|nr:division/cell wall cluster transcriptional repressor MraZ [Deltaproteobacteria bacterium]